MTPAGLLGTLSDWYERNKDRIYGGGVRGAATRGLLGVEAPQQMTPAQREVYENAVRIGAPALGAGKAIFIGAKAKSWNKEAAKRFEQLEKEGLSNREAFAQTGTFRGPDGQLRQEISDLSAKFDASQLLPQGEPPSMQAIRELERAQVYKQFLADKKTPKKASDAFEVKFGEKPSQSIIDAASKYSSSKDLFEETERLRGLRLYGPRPKIEQAVQHPEFLGAYPEIGSSTRVGRLQRGESPGSVGMYRPNQNLIEVAVGAENPKAVVLHELQHAVQQREGFSPGGVAGSYKDYLRLAGEAEARAVEKRMDYTPEQRRSVFPIDDYDVPLDQLIVRAQSNGPAMSLLSDAPQAQAMETARKNAVKMLGLPENNTAMDRARALGFGDDWYHGTQNAKDGIDAFKPSVGYAGQSPTDAVWLAQHPYIADDFATWISGLGNPTVYPLKVRAGKTANIADLEDAAIAARVDPDPQMSLYSKKVQSALRSKGFDSARFDSGDGDYKVVFEPSRLRSRFAAFDPARIDDKDLLATLAALGITLPLTMGLLSDQTD